MDLLKHWGTAFLLSSVALIAPLESIFITTFCLIFVDFVTGILASQKRGEIFKSAKARRSISKFLIYCLAVVCGYFVEKVMISDVFPVSKLISGTIGFVELSSLLENCNTILGTNIFDKLIEKLGSGNDKKSD